MKGILGKGELAFANFGARMKLQMLQIGNNFANAIPRKTFEFLKEATSDWLDFQRQMVRTAEAMGYAGDKAGWIGDKVREIGQTLQAPDAITKLMAALREVGPVAERAGIPIDKVIAQLGKLIELGYSGSKAGTQYKMILAYLAAPTEAILRKLEQVGGSATEAQKIFERYGIELGDTVPVKLAKLEEAHITLEEAIKLFGKRAAKPAIELFNALTVAINPNRWRSWETDLRN